MANSIRDTILKFQSCHIFRNVAILKLNGNPEKK